MSKCGVLKMVCIVLVFSMATATASPAQTFTTLVSFAGVNGANSESSLIQGSDGNLYGTAPDGGANGVGTIFKITPAGTLTMLYSFCSQPVCSDGGNPYAGLVQGTDGNFYGTASNGGASNACGTLGCGTVFKITPGGTLTTLHSFDRVIDGANPYVGLVQAVDGNLYGTTSYGGANGGGTVFTITPGGTLTTLYNFCSQASCSDGANPYAGLVQGTDMNFYGTTRNAGASNGGTVFTITPAGTLTTLYNFCSQTACSDGANPFAGLVQGADGSFYGTTSNGGASTHGTVFKITAGGTLSTLHSFDRGTDGASPGAGLVQAADGNFYGTTSYGGTNAGGTVFKITPGGTLTTLYSFCSQTNCSDGVYPYAGLVQAADGKFYGTTFLGGASESCGRDGCGTVFSLSGVNFTSGDFDGDGKADYAVWRPSTGTWFVIPSNTPTNPLIQQFGAQGDIPVRGDYDGDGKTDFAVFRPSNGTWYIIPSSNPSVPIVEQWGTQGDIPVPGDYDGDGKTDLAVFRPSTGTWFIIPSSNPGVPIVKQWGTQGDIPVPGDYDGDGKTDLAVWGPSSGTWSISPSRNPSVPIVRQWGASADIPVPGDYDGDGKTDFAVWRPSTATWYVIPSTNPNAPMVQQWGVSTDIPVPLDYDGDRKTDFAVWRPSNGTWYVIPSRTPSTPTVTQWGISTDVPVQKPVGQ